MRPELPIAETSVDEPALPVGSTLVEKAPLPVGSTLVEKAPLPVGSTLVAPEEPSIGDKIVGRFLGTDVGDDPLELPRLGTTITGALSGAYLGGKAGAALGALTGPAAPFMVPAAGLTGLFAGGAVGALAGGAAPEGVLEAGEFFGLLEEGTRDREGLSPEELRTVAEGEALLDLATGGGLVVLRGIGRGAAVLFTGARKKLAEQAARQGIDMMPVQVGSRVIGRGFVAVFGRFPFLGGGVIRRRGAKAEEQMRDVALSFAERIGPLTDASDLGKRIFAGAKALVKETNNYFNVAYTKIFARADELGVHVVPKETLAKAEEILGKLAAQTPATLVGETTPGPALLKVREFIEEAIQPLHAVIPDSGVKVFANQSLKQMDGLISKIDQTIGALEPGQKKFALSLLNQLRQAAQADVLVNIRGIGADEIGRAMRELDTEFSHTMSELFETATAKRFATVEKRGLRAIEFDRTTRTPVDQLARIVVDLKSPQAIDELSRLVTPDTMQRITAHVIDDAMQMAMKTDGFVGQLDINVFAKRLGLDGTDETRRLVVYQMLKKSGSPITPRDLDDIVAAGQALAGFEIPNVSSFIARRGAIGGLQAILNGVIPGLALLGGGASATWASAGPFIGTILLVGGSHLFARVISNPKSARALHKVFDKEVPSILRRTAAIEAIRGGLEAMRDLGEITAERYLELEEAFGKVVDALDQQVRMMAE